MIRGDDPEKSRFPTNGRVLNFIDQLYESGKSFCQIIGAIMIFTSESVSEGHPDKVADLISDRILDAALSEDPNSRVACETLCKNGTVVIAGEITSNANLDYESIVRSTVREIGYSSSEDVFNADSVNICSMISTQSHEIAAGVDSARDDESTGAGDQGLMFGYATDETPSLMPLPITLAHSITKNLSDLRHNKSLSWLRPDAKSQVSVKYQDGKPTGVSCVVISTQHNPEIEIGNLREIIESDVIPVALGSWVNPEMEVLINPAGTFVLGGPSADCGLTGRKIIADTYGGMARHGGGAFSGKDSTKVDRSAAYFCRWVARQIVESGIARRVELQVAYAIGRAQPVSIRAETFGTGDAIAAERFASEFDYRPGSIITQLGLKNPIFASSTNYGHFGRSYLPWEQSP